MLYIDDRYEAFYLDLLPLSIPCVIPFVTDEVIEEQSTKLAMLMRKIS